MTDIQVYNLDDLVMTPEIIKESKVFRKARLRKQYEIIIPDEESDILLRDLKTSVFHRQADRLVKFYLEANKKVKNQSLLSQNSYYVEYAKNHNYKLPWLIPIVRDQKLVYKRKYETPLLTVFQNATQQADMIKNMLNYMNVDNSQIMIENRHNYVNNTSSKKKIVNHFGSEVIRVRLPLGENEEIKKHHLEFRGSYGDQKMTQLIERAKSSKKKVIIGHDLIDHVVGEQLEVIGFVKLPLNHPSTGVDPNWYQNSEIAINPNKLDKVLEGFLPNVNEVINLYQTNGATDLRTFLKILEFYGHSMQSLTVSNRQQISQIILTNISNMEFLTYQRTDRLNYQFLEKELLGSRSSGILSTQILDHPALMTYRIKFENFPHIYHQYLRIIQKLDNGEVWLALLNKNNTPADIEHVVRRYNLLNLFREIMSKLETSYNNLLADTPPNMKLYEHAGDNPIDSISDLRPDKRDQIAWFQFFKRAHPGKNQKSYYFRDKWIGCQHEHDSLYQKFEDNNDPYPYGKRYTRMTPHNGVICGFCGDTLVDDNDLINQGYDQRGQRVNTYDNDALLRTESNIDVFLKKDKAEIVKSGEKLVEQWLEISEKKLTKRQIKAFKYALLKTYEDAILTDKFYIGLQQNPNKMLKGANNRQFGEFFIDHYKIANAGVFPTSVFIQKLFQFFYSISAIEEIVMQRLAVFLVILNWQLVQEDPVYLNPKVLLGFWNPEEIGQAYLQYNLNGKSQMMGLDTKSNKSNSDGFRDYFMERAVKRYPQKDMSDGEFQKFIKLEYQKYRSQLLYTPDEIGQVFNGVNPLAHEIIEIYSEYRKSNGQVGIKEHVNELFVNYWDQWQSTHQLEIKNIQERTKIANLSKNVVLQKISPTNRPLYDRFLAQKKHILTQELQQIYLDIINDNIYNIRSDKSIDGGNEQIIMKKMFLLNKMNCDDWNDMSDLELVGLEQETLRITRIMKIKQQIQEITGRLNIAHIDNRPYLRFAGGYLVNDLAPRDYTIYRTKYVPPDLFKQFEQAKKSPNKKKQKFLYSDLKQDLIESIVLPEPSPDIKIADLPKSSKVLRDLSFLGKITDLVNNLGNISYLKDLAKFDLHTYMIINGQMNGTEQCNTKPSPTLTAKNFQTMYDDAVKNQYVNSKMQLTNLKKYIISQLRHHIQLMSRITDRTQMIAHGLKKYLHLFDHDEFNAAFENFNKEEDDDLGKILTNDQIENLVNNVIPDQDKHNETSEILQMIFLTDIVRHLRQVRNRAGRFVRGKKKHTNDEANAADIFEEFVGILFSNIKRMEEVNDVDFNHLRINQMFTSKMMWKQMDKAEKRGELEWKILRNKLTAQEYELEISATGIDEAVVPNESADPEDEELDMENDEDDYNDLL